MKGNVKEKGIPIEDATWDALRALAEGYGVKERLELLMPGLFSRLQIFLQAAASAPPGCRGGMPVVELRDQKYVIPGILHRPCATGQREQIRLPRCDARPSARDCIVDVPIF